MVEKIVIDWLGDVLPAYGEVPEDFPEPPFAVVGKTGGSESEHISGATVAVQSYGKDLLEAARTNERVKARMKKLIELDAVSQISLNTDYNFTDTTTKRYRYQAVFHIVYYG